MRGLVEQFPDPRRIPARNRCRDVARRVAQIDGIYLRRAICGEEARGQGQDSPPVCGCGLGEDADDLGGIALDKLCEGVELCIGRRGDLGWGEGDHDGAEEGDVLDLANVWVGAREEGLEDAGEVQRVEGRGEAACDDSARPRQVVACGVKLAAWN